MSLFLRRAGALALLVLFLDELLKSVARLRLAPCPPDGMEPCDRLVLAGPVWLMRLTNGGSIGGFEQGLLVWVVLAAVGVLLIPIYGWRLGTDGWLAPAAVGMQTGGALGNLLDRLVLGGATDVLYVGRGPIWNLADAAIVAGMVLAVWALSRRRTALPLPLTGATSPRGPMREEPASGPPA